MEVTLQAYLRNLRDLGNGSRNAAVVDAKVVVEDLEQLCLRELTLDEDVALGAALIFHKVDGASLDSLFESVVTGGLDHTIAPEQLEQLGRNLVLSVA